jgi:hypothetical protein
MDKRKNIRQAPTGASCSYINMERTMRRGNLHCPAQCVVSEIASDVLTKTDVYHVPYFSHVSGKLWFLYHFDL